VSLRFLAAFLLGALALGFLEWRYSISSLFAINLEIQGRRLEVADVFGPQVPIVKTAVGERFSPTGDTDDFCVVAVVRLADHATKAPPKSPIMDRAPDVFGGNWRKAPETSVIAPASDAMQVCAEKIPLRLQEELTLALSRPSAYFIRDLRSKVLQIYSYEDLLAAYIRFGAHSRTP
jgi:hypothetical protein